MTLTERLADPPLFTAFPFNVAKRLLAPGDIRATAEQRDAYLRFAQMGDPQADAVVAMFRRFPAGEGRRMFEIALEEGIDAVEDPPAELVAFFAEVDAVPYWVDADRLDLACRAIGRTGVVAGFTSLLMFALLGGYLASRVVKTLVATGDLDRMAPRRIAETTAWHSAVTTPGGLARFAAGFKGALRVRLMHAMVRAGMSRKPDWDFEQWDHPVNQSQLAGTNMLFAVANVTGAQALGLHFSRREKEAIYHFWRYVGYLMGVAPEILPTNDFDNWRLLWLQADYEFGRPDQDSVKLARALVRAIGPLVIGDGEDVLHRGARYMVTEVLCAYARLILGKDNADFLGLPDHRWFQAVVVAVAATNAVLEYPRRLLPGATRCSEIFGRRSWQALTRRIIIMHKADATYRRHDRLAGAVQTPVPRTDQARWPDIAETPTPASTPDARLRNASRPPRAHDQHGGPNSKPAQCAPSTPVKA